MSRLDDLDKEFAVDPSMVSPYMTGGLKVDADKSWDVDPADVAGSIRVPSAHDMSLPQRTFYDIMRGGGGVIGGALQFGMAEAATHKTLRNQMFDSAGDPGAFMPGMGHMVWSMPKQARQQILDIQQTPDAEREKMMLDASADLANKTRAFLTRYNFTDQNYYDDLVSGVGSMLAMAPPSIMATIMGGPAAGAVASSLVESASEAGNVYQELTTTYGMDPAKAQERARWVYLANLPLNAVTDYGLNRFLPDSPLFEKLAGVKGAKAIARVLAGDLGAQAGKQGAEEMIQNVISSTAETGDLKVSKLWDKGMWREGTAGAGLGALSTLVGAPSALAGRSSDAYHTGSPEAQAALDAAPNEVADTRPGAAAPGNTSRPAAPVGEDLGNGWERAPNPWEAQQEATPSGGAVPGPENAPEVAGVSEAAPAPIVDSTVATPPVGGPAAESVAPVAQAEPAVAPEAVLPSDAGGQPLVSADQVATPSQTTPAPPKMSADHTRAQAGLPADWQGYLANQARVEPKGRAAEAAAKFAARLGLNVTWVHAPDAPAFHGAFIGDVAGFAPNDVVVNLASKRPALAVVSHEAIHYLRSSHADLYAELVQTVNGLVQRDAKYARFRDQQIASYKTIGHDLSENDVFEELLADSFGQMMHDRGFWQELAGKSPSTFERLRGHVQDLLTKLREVLRLEPRSTDALKMFTDIQTVERAIASAATQMQKREAGMRATGPGSQVAKVNASFVASPEQLANLKASHPGLYLLAARLNQLSDKSHPDYNPREAARVFQKIAAQVLDVPGVRVLEQVQMEGRYENGREFSNEIHVQFDNADALRGALGQLAAWFGQKEVLIAEEVAEPTVTFDASGAFATPSDIRSGQAPSWVLSLKDGMSDAEKDAVYGILDRAGLPGSTFDLKTRAIKLVHCADWDGAADFTRKAIAVRNELMQRFPGRGAATPYWANASRLLAGQGLEGGEANAFAEEIARGHDAHRAAAFRQLPGPDARGVPGAGPADQGGGDVGLLPAQPDAQDGQVVPPAHGGMIRLSADAVRPLGPATESILASEKVRIDELSDPDGLRGVAKFKKEFGAGWHQARRLVFDEPAALDWAVQDALKAAGQEKAAEFATQNPYVMARLAAGAPELAAAMIRHGIPNAANTSEVVHKGLDLILADNEIDTAEKESWLNILLVANQLEDYDRAHEVRADGKTAFVSPAALAKWTTAREEVLASEHGAQIAKAAEEVASFNAAFLKWMRAMNLVSPVLHDKLAAMYTRWVPIHNLATVDRNGKVSGANRGAKAAKGLNYAHGFDEDFVPASPLDTIQQNVHYLVTAGTDNMVRVALSQLAEWMPGVVDHARPKMQKSTMSREQAGALASAAISDIREDIGLSDEALAEAIGKKLSQSEMDALRSMWRVSTFQEKGVIAYRIKGEVKYLKVSDEIYGAFTRFAASNADELIRWLSTPTRILRTSVTSTFGFAVGNLTRDFRQALVMGKHAPTPMELWRGLVASVNRNADYWDWVNAQGGHVSAIAPDQLMGRVRALNQSPARRFSYIVVHPNQWGQLLSVFNYMGETSDMIARIPQYLASKRVLTKRAAKGSGMSVQDINFEAALNSRQASLDFMQGGKITKQVNRVSAFTNPKVLGISQLVIGMKERPARTVGGAMLIYTLPQVILWSWQHDDEYYKRQPAWMKAAFYILPVPGSNGEHVILIPKGQELSMLFGSSVEAMLNAWHGDDPEAAKAWAGQFAKNLNPIDIPTAIKPVVETMTNFSFFKQRHIVSDWKQVMPAQYQFDANTPDIDIWLAETKPGKIVGISPAKLDNLVRGYFGTWGGIASDMASDLLIGIDDSYARPVRSKHKLLGVIPMERTWFVGRFFKSSLQSNSRYVERFETDLNQSVGATRALREQVMRNRYRPARMKALVEDEIENLETFRAMNQVADNIQAVTQYIWQVEAEPLGEGKFTADEKRDVRDARIREIDTMAQTALTAREEMVSKLRNDPEYRQQRIDLYLTGLDKVLEAFDKKMQEVHGKWQLER